MIEGENPRLSPWAATGVTVALLAVLWAAHRHHLEHYAQSGLDIPGVVIVEGRVTYIRPTLGGGRLVSLRTAEGTRQMLIAPHLGSLQPEPRVDEFFRVSGTSRSWRGREFLEPLSRRAIIRLRSVSENDDYRRVNIEQAGHLDKKQKVRIVVKVSQVETFTSRAGKTHLRYQIHDHSGSAGAIMWQGTFTDRDQKLLASGHELLVAGIVDRYRGRLSVVVRGLEAYP